VRQPVTIGIIGDFNPEYVSHTATNAAIDHAASALGVVADVQWLPTPALGGPDTAATLERFDGLWASPGSPYRSMEGALTAIRFARERDRPFIGT
jgi:CTP synthase (UTP-ammonia lyase)